jgi:hypothetical protein
MLGESLDVQFLLGSVLEKGHNGAVDTRVEGLGGGRSCDGHDVSSRVGLCGLYSVIVYRERFCYSARPGVIAHNPFIYYESVRFQPGSTRQAFGPDSDVRPGPFLGWSAEELGRGAGNSRERHGLHHIVTYRLSRRRVALNFDTDWTSFLLSGVRCI